MGRRFCPEGWIRRGGSDTVTSERKTWGECIIHYILKKRTTRNGFAGGESVLPSLILGVF